MFRVTRILYTAFDLVPSPKGASTHITQFLRGLVGASYDVHLMTPGDGILPDHDLYVGATMTRVSRNLNANFLEQAIMFGQAVMEHVATAPRYDIVHFRSIWSGLALAQNKQRFGYKTIYEVNGLPSIELKYHYPGLQETGLLDKIREQELAALALVDSIIVVSDVTRSFLASLGVPREKITIIRNGVSTNDFVIAPPLPADNHTPTILYIGTLADWQGLEILIEAIPLVLTKMPVRIRIVGRGRGRQRKVLVKRIRKLGLENLVSVESAVPHDQVPALIASADVCVAPLALSDRNVTQGCCPIKVIECMAVGRPLVASNLPVVRELAREDTDALFFAPNDVQDLARQLLRVLTNQNLAQRLAASAAERAHSSLTWHAAQKKLLAVYERLL